MIYPVVADLASGGIAVAVACRVLGVSTSGFYAWRSRPVCARQVADQALTDTIIEIHQMSRGSYGVPRVHAELRLGAGVRCGRKRVERLMRAAGLQGVYRRRRPGCTVRDPDAEPSADLVQRRFVADGPDRLWVTDITQHRTAEGWVYCAVVLDVFARRVVGWSIADHLRTELVVDALDMARWRRQDLANAIFEGIEAAPAALRPWQPVPDRLRTTPHPGRYRGLTITEKPSGKPGKAQRSRAATSAAGHRMATGSSTPARTPTPRTPAGAAASTALIRIR
jgi:hypothetical protein